MTIYNICLCMNVNNVPEQIFNFFIFPHFRLCTFKHNSWTKLPCYFCKSKARILVCNSGGYEHGDCNPAERRYVTQLAMKSHHIWGELPSILLFTLCAFHIKTYTFKIVIRIKVRSRLRL